MKWYFKITGWLYLIGGVTCAILTVYFQVKGKNEEALLTLFSLFVCGIMMGIRSWQKKRLEKLDQFIKEKNQKKEIKTSKQ
ncbi:MAG: hypothetical protein ACK5D5_09870 [Bacteroidota bacterium]|jgi:cytochrome c oxidase subunit IV